MSPLVFYSVIPKCDSPYISSAQGGMESAHSAAWHQGARLVSLSRLAPDNDIARSIKMPIISDVGGHKLAIGIHRDVSQDLVLLADKDLVIRLVRAVIIDPSERGAAGECTRAHLQKACRHHNAFKRGTAAKGKITQHLHA